MEARGLRVVRHLDLRAARHQPIERLAFGGSGEHGGDDAQPSPRSAVCLQLAFQQPKPMPTDEGAEQVDGVGRGDLVRQGVSEGRLATGVDQEV